LTAAQVQAHVPQVQQEQLQIVLKQHEDVFAKNPKKPSVTHLISFEVDTGDAKPIFIPPRRYHPTKQAIIDTEVEEMCRNGIVSRVIHPTWGAPAKAVSKPDGSHRIVVDYTRINDTTAPINFNPINMHDALQSLGTSKVFSTLDLASGFWQVPVDPKSRQKTALTCRAGVFAFNVMPFGLKNAPAVFQNLMSRVLGDLQWKIALFMSTVIIFSPTFKQHLLDVATVLDALRKANLSVKMSKCQFGQSQVRYSGFLATAEGIKPCPEKVTPIMQVAPPTNRKELDSFLGSVGVYQRFITKYSVKTEPLRLLKKKDQPFL